MEEDSPFYTAVNAQIAQLTTGTVNTIIAQLTTDALNKALAEPSTQEVMRAFVQTRIEAMLAELGPPAASPAVTRAAPAPAVRDRPHRR